MNAKLLPTLLTGSAVALLLAACSTEEATEEAPRGVAITNVTVIDAAGGQRDDQLVWFDGDEILAVQPAGDAVNAAETIDGSGRYLIPGLWDMHVHLTYEEGLIDSMPALFLAHGITSVRDTGGLIRNVAPVVEAMRAEGAIAPRAYFAGPLLDGRAVVYDGDSRPEIGTRNRDAGQARANVEALAEAGVDFIKIYELVSPDVFTALEEAAEAHDLPIAAHVPLSMLAGQAGPRVDSMEHLRNVELDCAASAPTLHEERLSRLAAHDSDAGFELRSELHALQRMAAIADYDPERCARTVDALTGTIQVPTLTLNTLSMHPVWTRDDWDTSLELAPPAVAAAWRESTNAARERSAETTPDTTFAEWSLELVGRMNSAGVPIGAGTDTPIGWLLPGHSLHIELERLVEAGLSPLEALTAATVRPAEFLSLGDQMGQVEVGMRADLVLLDANPLDDISNTRTVHRVISRGRVLDPASLLNL